MHYPALHLLVAALSAASCATTTKPTESMSTDALVRALSARGVTVMRAGATPASAYPFFSVAAQRVVVNGADVQAFEYPDATRADRDAARVSPAGTPIGQSQISWMDIPHFYKRDRLIVLYVGHAADVTALLESTLGPTFAAGR